MNRSGNRAVRRVAVGVGITGVVIGLGFAGLTAASAQTTPKPKPASTAEKPSESKPVEEQKPIDPTNDGADKEKKPPVEVLPDTKEKKIETPAEEKTFKPSGPEPGPRPKPIKGGTVPSEKQVAAVFAKEAPGLKQENAEVKQEYTSEGKYPRYFTKTSAYVEAGAWRSGSPADEVAWALREATYDGLKATTTTRKLPDGQAVVTTMPNGHVVSVFTGKGRAVFIDVRNEFNKSGTGFTVAESLRLAQAISRAG